MLIQQFRTKPDTFIEAFLNFFLLKQSSMMVDFVLYTNYKLFLLVDTYVRSRQVVRTLKLCTYYLNYDEILPVLVCHEITIIFETSLSNALFCSMLMSVALNAHQSNAIFLIIPYYFAILTYKTFWGTKVILG